MSQITIYLRPELAQKIRDAAMSEGISQSRWIAKLVEKKLESEWPKSIRQLAGAWPDFPEAEELRKDQALDTSREPL
jgi:hypothetical protein